MGNPQAYGQITVYEPHFTVNGNGRGISAGPEMFGSRGTFLQDEYDSGIAQAAANVLKREILHTRTVDAGGDKDKKADLAKRGYQARKGYSQFWDKIYKPE